MTTVLAVLGTVLGAIGTTLHVARFVWDRPRLVLRIDCGIYGGAISAMGAAPPLPGFRPGEHILSIEIVKKGQGATKVESAGIRYRDGWFTPFLIASDPDQPKLGQGDKLVFYAHASAIREAKDVHGGIRDYFCSTTEGERHLCIPRHVRQGIETARDEMAPV